MNNRVDYLSDKLVNLRGKLKNVNDVVPPESITNGVSNSSVGSTAARSSANQAQERRREQTVQLAGDYEQRLQRRLKQLDIFGGELARKAAEVQTLQQELKARIDSLAEKKLSGSDEISAVQLGELYRTIDRERLEFFATDGAIELLLESSSRRPQESSVARPGAESFGALWKKSWALALSLGLVLGIFMLAAALIIFMGWR